MIPANFLVKRLRMMCNPGVRRYTPSQQVMLRRLVTDFERQALRLVSERPDELELLLDNSGLTCLALFSCTAGAPSSEADSAFISFSGRINLIDVAFIRSSVNALYQTTIQALDEAPQVGVHLEPVSATIALIGEDNKSIDAYLFLHRDLQIEQGVALLWERFHTSREGYYAYAMCHPQTEH